MKKTFIIDCNFGLNLPSKPWVNYLLCLRDIILGSVQYLFVKLSEYSTAHLFYFMYDCLNNGWIQQLLYFMLNSNICT